ncbi:MAG: glycosyl hydrolase family 5 [Fibrobacter sp.]|nr:glycosyl hydrolase family 5 [Fibrobacter sp.]
MKKSFFALSILTAGLFFWNCGSDSSGVDGGCTENCSENPGALNSSDANGNGGDNPGQDGFSSANGNGGNGGDGTSSGSNPNNTGSSDSGNGGNGSSGSNNTEESSSSSDPNLDENGFPTIESYGEPPAAYTKDILNNGQTGWSSRYWDACKGHCSQRDNVATESDEAYAAGLTVMRNCNIHDVEVPAFTLSPDVQQYYMGYKGTDNACQAGEAGTFTCTDMAPIQVTENLSYGYVAAPGVNAACGKCFHLQFNGGNKINDVKPTHLALKGKHMIVLASNIGHDVESGQFDMMVPGGGVGNYNALSTQIGVPPSGLGAGGGGFLTECQLDKGLGYNNTLEAYQQCVIEKCDEVFKDWPNLLRGCKWFAEWYMAADNPTYNWEEVECPQYLIDHYVSSYNTKKDNNYKWRDDWSTFKKGDVLDTLHCWGPGQNPDPNGGAGCL